MKKYLFLFGALVLTLASCTDDDDNSNVAKEVEITSQTVDNSRILTPKVVDTRATRAAVADPAAPAIPEDAIEFDKDAFTNWNDGVLLSVGKNYKVTKPYVGSVSIPDGATSGEINIYVAADAEFTTWWENGVKANVYILPGNVLQWDQSGNDYMKKIPYNTSIYCWGNLTTPDNYGLRLYCDNEKGAAKLFIYSSEADESEFVVKTAKNIYWDDPKSTVTFQVDNACEFYCSRVTTIQGNAQFEGGTSHFANAVTIEGNCWPEFQAEVTFDVCSYILGQLDDKASQGAVFNVNEYLYVGSLHSDDRNFTINLNEALLDVDSKFNQVYDGYTENRLTEKGGGRLTINGSYGEYYSVVRILNDGILYIDRGNDYTVGGTWPNQYIESYNLNNFQGYVNIIGTLRNKLYYTPGEGIDYETLNSDNLVLPENVLLNDGDVYLPATECRPQIGYTKVIITTPDVEHKYSATGMDFAPDGTLYLCWHSNIGGEQGDGHDTGTNMEDGDTYSPSVENENDWGGIVDVIDVNTYDPAKTLFKQTVIQHEHKYNHVKYYNDKLYLASTSNKVRAALHEVALLADGTLNESESYRVNLTGGSANCVEVVGDQLVTISGWAAGGLNKFAFGDYSNQEKKYINEATDNYAGKFVYYDQKANKVVTLNNTDEGTVTIYNPSTFEVEKTFNVGSIKPRDGKNVCIADGQYIYICLAQNGFRVYDYNGNRVGGNNLHAIGVDVDDENIYITTGDGFAILSKTMPLDNANNAVRKVIKYTGTGFVYPGTRGGKTDESVKESANYIRVKGDNIYVAYGMYGMRIYSLANILGN